MPDHKRLTVKGAATELGRSERSVRRYLTQKKLTGERVDMAAGGWQWLITRASVDKLKEQLQGGAPPPAVQGVDELTAQVQALQELVNAQTERIAGLERAVQRLLPAGPEEEHPKKRPWWAFWREEYNE